MRGLNSGAASVRSHCPCRCDARTAAFDPARGLSNFVHVFIMQVDQIAKRANDAYRAWLGRSVAVDVALHFERPLLSVLVPSERLGHITGLAADLDAPVSR